MSMKYLAALLVILLGIACTKLESPIVDSVDQTNEEVIFESRTNDKIGNFRGHLAGDETLAAGQVIFRFAKDNSEVYFKLIVANIENVRMAHLHHSHMGHQPGHAVLTLFNDIAPGTTNGIFAEGTLTYADITCPCPDASHHSLAHLRGHVEDGETSVLVHTVAFPDGEISGPIH